MPSGKENAEQRFEISGYDLYKSYHGNWVLRRQGEGSKEIVMAWSSHEVKDNRITLDLQDSKMEAELTYNPNRMDSPTLLFGSYDTSRADAGSYARFKIPKSVYKKIVELIHAEEMVYG